MSSNSTELWWTNWWDRNIIDQNNKIDGWESSSEFFENYCKIT